jgi:hypothetical protein
VIIPDWLFAIAAFIALAALFIVDLHLVKRDQRRLAERAFIRSLRHYDDSDVGD